MLHVLNDKKKHHSSITYEELVRHVNSYETLKLPGLGSNQHITPFGLSEWLTVTSLTISVPGSFNVSIMWRRVWDLNSRYFAVCLISNQMQSAGLCQLSCIWRRQPGSNRGQPKPAACFPNKPHTPCDVQSPNYCRQDWYVLETNLCKTQKIHQILH